MKKSNSHTLHKWLMFYIICLNSRHKKDHLSKIFNNTWKHKFKSKQKKHGHLSYCLLIAKIVQLKSQSLMDLLKNNYLTIFSPRSSAEENKVNTNVQEDNFQIPHILSKIEKTFPQPHINLRSQKNRQFNKKNSENIQSRDLQNLFNSSGQQ